MPYKSLARLNRISTQIEQLKRAKKGRPKASEVIDPIEPPDLLTFFCGAWEVLEPGRDLHLNWHIELICEWLTKLYQGDVKRLLINIAPRHSKSRIASVAFPCWVWLHKPQLRFLCLSYDTSLANDHNNDRRKVIQSQWYQQLSGGMKLSSSMNRLSEFENSSMGVMRARGLDGAVTGVGGDFQIYDDPNNPKQVESDLIRKATLEKFKDYSITRRDDPKGTAIAIIQQRTHTEDVAGYAIREKLGYTELILPTEAEKHEVIHFPLSGKVVHRKPGDLLDPDRMGWEQVEEAKKTLGSATFAARHQQRPSPKGGNMIQMAWFNRYDTPPARFDFILQSWDTALKAKDSNDPWACSTWGRLGRDYYLLDMFVKRMDYVVGKPTVRSLAWKWKPNVILIEDKASGTTLIQELKAEAGFYFPIFPVLPEADKETRMFIECPVIEARQCWLPRVAPWLPELEDRLESYPASVTKDEVDSISQALMYFRVHGRLRVSIPASGELQLWNGFTWEQS